MHKGDLYIFKPEIISIHTTNFYHTMNRVYNNECLMLEGIIDNEPVSLIKRHKNDVDFSLFVRDFIKKTANYNDISENYSETNFHFNKLFDSRYQFDSQNPDIIRFKRNLTKDEQLFFFSQLNRGIKEEKESRDLYERGMNASSQGTLDF